MRELLRIGDQVAVGSARAGLPSAVDDEIVVTRIKQPGADHEIGLRLDAIVAHLATKRFPTVPSHRWSCGEARLCGLIRASEYADKRQRYTSNPA